MLASLLNYIEKIARRDENVPTQSLKKVIKIIYNFAIVYA